MDDSTSNAGRSTGAIIAVALVLLVAIAVAVALIQNRTGEPVTDRFDGVTTIEFDLDNGRVTARAADDARVSVERLVSVGPLGGSFRYEQDGATLRIVQRCPPLLGWGCRADVTIDAPATVTLTGGTSNGSLDLAGISGTVDVRTSNGPIDLADLSGAVTVRTSNGSIGGAGLSTPTLEARTSNGRISLAFAVAPDTVDAQTSNGRIEVVVPADAPAYAVDASTSNGTTTVDIRTDPASPSTLDLTSSNGDIEVRTP